MITEREFAAGYHDFWRELLPLLTPSLVGLLNSGHEELLLNGQGQRLGPVPQRPETRDHAIVSEYAYHLARLAIQTGSTIDDAAENPALRQKAQAIAITVVNSYESHQVIPDNNLNLSELQEGAELALRYPVFINTIGVLDLANFTIPIPGAGFLATCNADMAVGTTLVEIKTVTRRLASKDVRQLIAYLALNHAACRHSFSHAGFFNPRRGTYHRWLVAKFIEHLSGGRSAGDVFRDLIDYVCETDIQLDSAF